MSHLTTADRTALKVRAQALRMALDAEIDGLNAAIAAGATVILPTFSGPYEVRTVSSDLWASCRRPGATGSALDRAGFALCNDGAWADLLRQAGVQRAEMFR